MSLFLVGKSFNIKSKSKTGGAIMLFEELKHTLRVLNVGYTTIDYNKQNYRNSLVAFYRVTLKLLLISRRNEMIFFNGSSPSIFTFGLVLAIGKQLWNFPLVLRFFGDSLDEYLNAKIWPLRIIGKFVLKSADLLIVETNRLKRSLDKDYRTFVLPNTRTRNDKSLHTPAEYSKAFVFVGHVSELKGIEVLISAFDQLDNSYSLCIYGPIVSNSGFTQTEVFKKYYKGALEPDQVLLNMSKHNYLILPSFKEGYPGVVIEALSIGMPLIVTALPSLTEMLDESFTKFISPGDVNALKSTIQMIDQKSYSKASNKAYNYFSNFDSITQTKRVITELDSLLNE